jgi:hypothetical protein
VSVKLLWLARAPGSGAARTCSAELRSVRVDHHEVLHALQQELILALENRRPSMQRPATKRPRWTELVCQMPGRRVACADLLGMTPGRYQR